MTCNHCAKSSEKAAKAVGAPEVEATWAENREHPHFCPACHGFLRKDGGCTKCESMSGVPDSKDPDPVVGYYRSNLGPMGMSPPRKVYATREISPENFNPMTKGLNNVNNQQHLQVYVDVVGGREWITISKSDFSPKVRLTPDGEDAMKHVAAIKNPSVPEILRRYGGYNHEADVVDRAIAEYEAGIKGERLRKLTEMKHPSVADLLRKEGFNYEAKLIQRVVHGVEGNDYDSWRTAFQPWDDDDGSPILHSWDEVKTFDPRFIWSLTEEDDIESVAPGFHHINNLGFYVCNKPSGADTAPVQITEPEEYLDRVVSNVVYDAEMAIGGDWDVDEEGLEVMADNLRRAISMNDGANSPRLKAAKILLEDVEKGLAEDWDIHDSDGWQAMIDTVMSLPD
jgi:hypothetical protein